MTADAATAPHRPAPGSRLVFRWRKWDGSPHWEHDCVFLGSDRWGDWVGQRSGWRSVRPGREVTADADNATNDTYTPEVSTSLGVYLAGMVTAGVVGYAAVALLLRLVVAMKLQSFVFYCALLGAAVLAAGLLGNR